MKTKIPPRGTTGLSGPLLWTVISSIAAVAFMVGVVAFKAGRWRGRKAEAAHCPGSDTATKNEQQPSYEELMAQNAKLKRALLAAMARGGRRDREPSCERAPLAAQAPPPEDDGVEATPPSPDEIRAQEKADLLTLQGQMDHEPVDPVWAPRTEQATERALAETGSMHVEEVTCRETLCRVRVTHHDLAAREHDVDVLLGIPPGGGQSRVYAPADDPTTVMYFSRRGNELSVLRPAMPLLPVPPPFDGEGSGPPPAMPN